MQQRLNKSPIIVLCLGEKVRNKAALKVNSRLYIVILLIELLCRVHHEKSRLDEAQAEIKIARRNINNPRYADDTTLMAEREEQKSLLMKVREESENIGLKVNM